ncbi:MAG: hypothetical protein RMJ33_07760 [Saprospiraceae bacterium]|nr:hypothetical protein [Saprospiraceae bacterium]MDW8229719.1 hypothetical protein [Saprospiraceae bacterium]
MKKIYLISVWAVLGAILSVFAPSLLAQEWTTSASLRSSNDDKTLLSEGASDTIRFTFCAAFWRDTTPLPGADLLLMGAPLSFGYPPRVLQVFSLPSGQHCTAVVMPPTAYPNELIFTFGGTLPSKNYRQGADAADLCLIARFLWGLGGFNAYQGLAADVNTNHSVVSSDFSQLLRLILAQTDTLAQAPVWYFYPALSPVFPNYPVNNYPYIHRNQLAAYEGDTLWVLGTKIGDVNGDYHRPHPPVKGVSALILPKKQLVAGQSDTLSVVLSASLPAYYAQMGFQLDTTLVELDDCWAHNGTRVSLSYHYRTDEGRLRVVLGQSEAAFPAGTPLFYMRIRAKKDVLSEEAIQPFAERPGRLPLFAVGGDCSAFYALKLDFQETTSAPISIAPEGERAVFAYTSDGSGALLYIYSPAEQPARLALFDATGRLIYESQRALTSGDNRWDLPAEVFRNKGLYAWQLMLGQRLLSGKALWR